MSTSVFPGPDRAGGVPEVPAAGAGALPAGPGLAEGPEEARLAIGEVAQLARVSERTLRYYEELGLLVPAGHSPGGCRRYAPAAVGRLVHIRELQEVMGYSLEEIQAILEAGDRLEAYQAASLTEMEMEPQRRLAEEALATIARLRERVRAKLARLERILVELDAASATYERRAGTPGGDDLPQERLPQAR